MPTSMLEPRTKTIAEWINILEKKENTQLLMTLNEVGNSGTYDLTPNDLLSLGMEADPVTGKVTRKTTLISKWTDTGTSLNVEVPDDEWWEIQQIYCEFSTCSTTGARVIAMRIPTLGEDTLTDAGAVTTHISFPETSITHSDTVCYLITRSAEYIEHNGVTSYLYTPLPLIVGPGADINALIASGKKTGDDGGIEVWFKRIINV